MTVTMGRSAKAFSRPACTVDAVAEASLLDVDRRVLVGQPQRLEVTRSVTRPLRTMAPSSWMLTTRAGSTWPWLPSCDAVADLQPTVLGRAGTDRHGAGTDLAEVAAARFHRCHGADRDRVNPLAHSGSPDIETGDHRVQAVSATRARPRPGGDLGGEGLADRVRHHVVRGDVLAIWSSMLALADDPKIDIKVTRATLIISADAVAAVRRGLQGSSGSPSCRPP